MAQRIEIKSITVSAGTQIATPQTTALPWRQGFPERVEFRIPPGASGLMGVRLLHSGTRVIPRSEDEWLVTDNESVSWPLEGYASNPNWTVQAYNLDVYPHTFQIRMLLNEIIVSQAPGFVPIDITPEGTGNDDSPEVGEDLPDDAEVS